MKEKPKLLSFAALVLYLLAVCLILAGKIDAQTQNQVTVRPYQLTTKSSGYFPVALTAVFYKGLSTEVFEVAEGTGWQDGLRVTLLNPNSYSIDFTPDTGSVNVNATRDMSVIKGAVHYPQAGEKARIVPENTREDTYLLLSERTIRPYRDVWVGAEVLAESENARLLSVPDGPDPFMENNVLWKTKSEINGLKAYSLVDVEAFLTMLPRLAVLAVILWATVVLGIFCCALAGSDGRRKALAFSLALEGALLAALLLLLKNISLPGTLLPPDSVLRISHYSQEFSAIFGALAQFGQEALFALRQRASVISIAILAVGFVLPLIWCAGWMAKRKKKAEDED